MSTTYADPRTPTTRIGTPIRDAATDPRPGDHLPPVNAGQADPHGPHVVSVQALSPRSGNPPAVHPHPDNTPED